MEALAPPDILRLRFPPTWLLFSRTHLLCVCVCVCVMCICPHCETLTRQRRKQTAAVKTHRRASVVFNQHKSVKGSEHISPRLPVKGGAPQLSLTTPFNLQPVLLQDVDSLKAQLCRFRGMFFMDVCRALWLERPCWKIAAHLGSWPDQRVFELSIADYRS